MVACPNLDNGHPAQTSSFTKKIAREILFAVIVNGLSVFKYIVSAFEW